MLASPDDNLTSNDGWISDDSDFFGSPTTTAALKSILRTTSPRAFWRIHGSLPSVLAYTSQTPGTLASDDAKPNDEETPQEKGKAPLYHPFDGRPYHRQSDESPSEFLARLPPLTTSHLLHPWIWVNNPYLPPSNQGSTVTAFLTAGDGLISTYREHEAQIRNEMAGRTTNSIGRKLGPLKRELEVDIKATAVKTGCVSGKWMLFLPETEVNGIWLRVCEGVIAGKLGPAAKVSPEDPKKTGEARVICVYTRDYNDVKDVKKVLLGLVDLGLVAKGSGNGISYKPDAYTYLDIKSKNEYNIKASIYSSKDMLDGGPKTGMEERSAKRKKIWKDLGVSA